MHVRIAWEIYYHQNKQNPDKLSTLTNPNSCGNNSNNINSNSLAGSGGGSNSTPNTVTNALNMNNIVIGGNRMSGIGVSSINPPTHQGVGGGGNSNSITGAGGSGNSPSAGNGSIGVGSIKTSPAPPLTTPGNVVIGGPHSSHLLHRSGDMPSSAAAAAAAAAAYAAVLPGRSHLFEGTTLSAANLISAATPGGHIGIDQ